MRTRWMSFVGVVALVLAASTGSAAAHGGEGELTLTTFEQVAPTSVRIEVGIVYENDGHLAEDAAVTATFAGPDGASVGPVELARTGPSTSLYAATVELPAAGDWTALVSSAEPNGQVSGAVIVDEGFSAEPTTTGPSTDGPTSTAPDAGESTTVPAQDGTTTTTAAGTSDETAASGSDDSADDRGGSNTPLLVGGGALLAAVVVGGGVALSRRDKG